MINHYCYWDPHVSCKDRRQFLRLCLELVSDGQINRNISGAHTNVHIPSFWAREFAAINSLGAAIETDPISMC